MPKWYAWSTIDSAQAGDTVTAKGLGLSDADFENLIAVGSVRETPYPCPADYDGSPADWYKEQVASIGVAKTAAKLGVQSDQGSTLVPPKAE